MGTPNLSPNPKNLKTYSGTFLLQLFITHLDIFIFKKLLERILICFLILSNLLINFILIALLQF